MPWYIELLKNIYRNERWKNGILSKFIAISAKNSSVNHDRRFSIQLICKCIICSYKCDYIIIHGPMYAKPMNVFKYRSGNASVATNPGTTRPVRISNLLTGRWQPPCKALTAGKRLPFGLCKIMWAKSCQQVLSLSEKTLFVSPVIA